MQSCLRRPITFVSIGMDILLQHDQCVGKLAPDLARKKRDGQGSWRWRDRRDDQRQSRLATEQPTDELSGDISTNPEFVD